MQRTSLLRALSLKPFTRWNPQSTPRPSMLLLGVARANDSVRVRIHRDGAVNRHFLWLPWLRKISKAVVESRSAPTEPKSQLQVCWLIIVTSPTEGERVLPLCKQSDIFSSCR